MKKRYNTLAQRYEIIKKGFEEISEKRLERSAKQENILAFIKEFEQREGLIIEFDEELWKGSIEKVVVNVDKEDNFYI